MKIDDTVLLPEEVFRPIPPTGEFSFCAGHYEVSNLGRIRSLYGVKSVQGTWIPYKREEPIILISGNSETKNPHVNLSKGGKRHSRQIKRAMKLAGF